MCGRRGGGAGRGCHSPGRTDAGICMREGGGSTDNGRWVIYREDSYNQIHYK